MNISLKHDYAPLLALAIPLVITGLMQAAITFIETVFLAQLGTDTLADGALVAWLYWTVITILFGTFSSINVLVSHQHGANDTQGIAHVFRDGLLLSIALAVPFYLLLWNMAPIFHAFGQSPKLVALATLYLHALAWGVLPKFIMIVCFQFLIGLGHARTMTFFFMCVIPVYAMLSYLLIFGKFGFPSLGIAGAGWGMTLTDWLATSGLLIYICYNKQYRIYLHAIFSFKQPYYLLEILAIGLPIGLMYCVEVGFYFALSLAMGFISVQTLAANQIAMQYMSTLMTSIFCISQAVTTRMGHELGAANPASAKRACYAGIHVVLVYMVIIAIIYITFPNLLIGIDLNSLNPQHAETIALAKSFLFVAAIFQIFEAVRIILFGALRSLKDTHFTLMISIISFWLISLPFGYLFGIEFNGGGTAFWWAMTAGASFGVLLLYRRVIASAAWQSSC